VTKRLAGAGPAFDEIHLTTSMTLLEPGSVTPPSKVIAGGTDRFARIGVRRNRLDDSAFGTLLVFCRIVISLLDVAV
jgi:hypothetical protein